MKYLLGYDLGSSSVKVTLLDIESGQAVASATSPSNEMGMKALKAGWAEQEPAEWWAELVNATHKLKKQHTFDTALVAGIGISYQMHGLVLIDKAKNVLRPSIIWCDSRSVEIGNKAFDDLGHDFCLSHLLNSPGNFTASKLRWVKENEPAIFEKIDKFMLPGDFIAMMMTGQVQTTASGLSEGIFWDFKQQSIAQQLLDYYGLDHSLIPDIVPTFGTASVLSQWAANELGLTKGTPVAYRAGDQPNNAFSLNVLHPGDLATTAGTSGVVYGINQTPRSDAQSRVNSFVHVNSTKEQVRNGVLLCVNGTGILNSWLRRISSVATGSEPVVPIGYEAMNHWAATAPIGSEGLSFFPFGNGAERMLANRQLSAQLEGLNFNIHSSAHLYRAGQEGIAFALEYGLKIMREMGVATNTVKAGYANMFLSPVFREAFANTTNTSIELFDTDGAQGAARAAGIGVGVYDFKTAFNGLKKLEIVEPNPTLQTQYQEAYRLWESRLKAVI